MKRKRLLVLGLIALGGGMLALGALDDKLINSRGSIFLNLDADNNNANEVLQVTTDGGVVPVATLTEDGDLSAEGPVRSYGGAFTAYNPDNASASVSLSWLNDVARLRVGGSGSGSQAGLDFQTQGDVSLMRILDNGDVGIGNVTPGYRLTLRDASHQLAIVDSSGGKTWTITTVGDEDLGFYEWLPGGEEQRLLIEEGGNVGINTNNPVGRLHVVRDDAGPGGYALVLDRSGGFTDRHIDIASDDSLRFARTGIADDMAIDAGGFVGIGTSTPSERLEVNGGDVKIRSNSDVTTTFGTGTLIIQDTADSTGLHIDKNEIQVISATNDALRINPDSLVNTRINNTLHVITNGRVGIGVTSPSTTLEVAGTTTTDVLVIEGGADLAEKFPASEAATPGTVMAIDSDRTGFLCVAREPYDRRVAGVVSGANDLPAGAVLGSLPGHEDAPAIALSGRVWVRCDATNGPIAPGDLLTTSGTPGHAMKASDHVRAQGAVLGKAMTALDDGRGLVLVLVSLQ